MKKLKRRLAWKTLLYCIWTVPETNSWGQHYANWRSLETTWSEKNTITHNAVVKTTWRLTDCGRETKENQNVCFSINSVVDQQQFVSRSSSETQQVNINSFTPCLLC